MTNALKWDETLDWAVVVYRAIPNSTTGETPIFPMLEMDNYLPIDSINPSRRDEKNEGDVNPLVDKSEFLTGLHEIAVNVQEKVLKSEERMKTRHDEGLKERVIVVGEQVMINERPVKGEGRKLKYRKHGPYRVGPT